MTDFSKMTVGALRELARKVLGPGHSRLKTKAEMVRALEEAAASAAEAPARAASRVRAAATRAADATEKAVRAVTKAVGKAARSSGKRTAGAAKPAAPEAGKARAKPAAAAGKAGAKAAARAGKAGAKPAAEAGKAGTKPAAEAGRRAGTGAARPGKAPAGAEEAGAAGPARKVRKVAEALVAAAGAVVSPRARRRPASAGPDPDGFFVARVRGEDAVRDAPHPLVEPAPAGDEDEEAVSPAAPDERLGELPWGYGDDAFVALPRDPRTLFLYWDWSPDTRARAFEGLDHPRAQLWILARSGEGWERVRTIDFALESRGYYVHDLQPGRTYRAEIHAVDRHGRERILSHGSNEVALPPVGPSPLVDDRFVRIPWELPLGRLVGPGHAGAPFSEEARALLGRLSDWSRFAGRESWGSSAGGMGGRPSSPTGGPSSPGGPFSPRER